MYHYVLEFETDGIKRHGFIKTELPQSQEALIRMQALDETSPDADQIQSNLTNVTCIGQYEAEGRFPWDSRTARRRTRDGDMFVIPNGLSMAVITIDGEPVQIALPDYAVNDDCTGNAAKLLLRDAVACAARKDPNTVTWNDLIKSPAPPLSKFGVYPQPADILLTLNASGGDLIFPETEYHQELTLDETESSLLEKYLSEPGSQPKDKTFVKTVKFPDGMQMDVKCCQSQDKTSWTEAVLFLPNGVEINCAAPRDTFIGSWEIKYNNRMYKTTVKASSKGSDDFQKLHANAHRKYIFQWLNSHGYEIRDVIMAVLWYARERADADSKDCKANDVMSLNFEELYASWERSIGINGSLWACMDEFLNAEYQDRDYVMSILSPDELAFWDKEHRTTDENS